MAMTQAEYNNFQALQQQLFAIKAQNADLQRRLAAQPALAGDAQAQQQVAAMNAQIQQLSITLEKMAAGKLRPEDIMDPAAKKKAEKKKKKADKQGKMMLNMALTMAMNSLGKSHPAIGILQGAMNGGTSMNNAVQQLMSLASPSPELSMVTGMMQMMGSPGDDDDDEEDES